MYLPTYLTTENTSHYEPRKLASKFQSSKRSVLWTLNTFRLYEIGFIVKLGDDII